MAEGIRKRHSKGCSAREGGRCNCKAGWEASVFLAREGKRITKTFRREAEARSWRADARRAAEQGGLLTPRKPAETLADGLRRFIAGMEGGTVRPKGRERYKPNTTRSYERALRVHIEPSDLAGIAVAQLRRRDLQDFADELLSAGLSSRTVSNVLNPIQAFYRWQIDRDELTYNPSARIDLPNGDAPRPSRVATPAEAAALLAALPMGDRPVWATAFYAGLRRGELQALRVRDIDFEANLIAVERGWDQVEGVVEPKSHAGRRGVPLLAILRDYLAQHVRTTNRSGDELIFGRMPDQAFYAATVDGRQASLEIGERARAAGGGGRGSDGGPSQADKPAPVPSHLRLAVDRLRRQPESDPGVHGALENPDDLRHLRPLAPRQPRRGSTAHGRLPAQQRSRWSRRPLGGIGETLGETQVPQKPLGSRRMGSRRPKLLAITLFALGIAGCGGSQHPSRAEEAALHRKKIQARKACLNKALSNGGSPHELERCADKIEAEEKERLEHPSSEAERILEERAAEREANEIEAEGGGSGR
jgi:integrase